MGKIKSLIMDYQDLHGYDIPIDEADLYEYHRTCYQEAIERGEAVYQLTFIEEEALHKHMEGKCPGDHTNTARTKQEKTYLTGQTIFGLRKKRNMPK